MTALNLLYSALPRTAQGARQKQTFAIKKKHFNQMSLCRSTKKQVVP